MDNRRESTHSIMLQVDERMSYLKRGKKFLKHLTIFFHENASKLEHSATFNANGTAIYSPAESRLAMRDITEHIEHGLAGIPENCREIYRMHIYAGMKTGEISRQTGDNYRSVEHRLGKARIYIRTYLSQCV